MLNPYFNKEKYLALPQYFRMEWATAIMTSKSKRVPIQLIISKSLQI